jgi:hypothetical protein
LQANPAGAIMVDHWIGAELASFSQQFAGDPVADSLVYLAVRTVTARVLADRRSRS